MNVLTANRILAWLSHKLLYRFIYIRRAAAAIHTTHCTAEWRNYATHKCQNPHRESHHSLAQVEKSAPELVLAQAVTVHGAV